MYMNFTVIKSNRSANDYTNYMIWIPWCH